MCLNFIYTKLLMMCGGVGISLSVSVSWVVSRKQNIFLDISFSMNPRFPGHISFYSWMRHLRWIWLWSFSKVNFGTLSHHFCSFCPCYSPCCHPSSLCGPEHHEAGRREAGEHLPESPVTHWIIQVLGEHALPEWGCAGGGECRRRDRRVVLLCLYLVPG